MLRAFDAVLLFRVGVRITRRAWATPRQAVGSVPANLTGALGHLANTVPSTVALACIWRECPDTLGQNGIEHWLEGFLLAIRPAHQTDVQKAERGPKLRPDLQSVKLYSFASFQILQHTAELGLCTAPRDVVEKSLLIPFILSRGTRPTLSELGSLLPTPSIDIFSLVRHCEVSGFPMDTSEQYAKVRSVVVEPGVVGGGQRTHTDEELVNAGPHPCSISVFQV